MPLKKIILISIIGFSTQLMASNITGNWTTIDDKTGQKRAIVKLSESKGKLSGTIIKVFPQPGDTGHCNNCSGNFKDKPIKGLQFLWGLKQIDENTWDKGQILDPKSGHIYKAKITQKGNKLDVRGYLGFSVLGRSQTWIK